MVKLIIPCAKTMVKLVLGEKRAEKRCVISLSNDTVCLLFEGVQAAEISTVVVWRSEAFFKEKLLPSVMLNYSSN